MTRKSTCGKYGILSSALLAAYIAVGVMLGTTLFLYVSVVVSPGLRRMLLRDVLECREFDYLSPGSLIRDGQTIDSRYPTGQSLRHTLMAANPGAGDSTTLSTDGLTKILPADCCPCAGIVPQDRNGESQRIGSSGAPSEKKFTVLVGILTQAWKKQRRDTLRMAYGVQSSDSEYAQFTVRFVVGALKDQWERTLVGMENATYGDIIILACKENINDGKTFTFFSSLPGLGLEYDYVLKTDDDSYVRFANLGKHLNPLPRMDLYYGYSLPCDGDDPYAKYMAGAGYLISWDLVLWIKDSPIPKNNSVGIEDLLVGSWFNEGGKAKNRAANKGLFYDHADSGKLCSHKLIPETILVHQVKADYLWTQVLAFFEKDRIGRALSNGANST